MTPARRRKIEASLCNDALDCGVCKDIRNLLAELRRRERIEDAVIEELRTAAHFDQSMEMAGALNRCRGYLGGDRDPPA